MFDPDDYELHQAQKHACRMAKERDEARVMADNLTAELAACAAALSGVYYMDPPDGGDVPVSEQLRQLTATAPLNAEIERLQASRSAEGDRLDWLLHKLPGSVLRELVGELSDTSDVAEWRAAIDRAAGFSSPNA